MTTQTAIDWNKAAQVTGVVLVALGKVTWWVAKHVGLIVVAVVTALFKVFMALISVWAASSGNSQPRNESYDLSRAVDPQNPGHDMMGRTVNIHRNHM